MPLAQSMARFGAVILDPELTRTLPRDVAAASGMDAISHVIESYVSTRRNPAAQQLAREAWELLERSFATALDAPGLINLRIGLQHTRVVSDLHAG